MRTIKYLVVHCSATPEGRDVDAKTIKSWHLNQGWSDIGYHYIIKLNGTVEKGRSDSVPGAGVKNYNKESIHICYIGGCDTSMKAKDTRTFQQKSALNTLLKKLKQQYPNAEILGHRDFPNVNKACPSFDAKSEYKSL